MQLTIKNLGKLFTLTFKEWANRDPFRLSAIIAYYAIFAIPGLLFLIINITGNIFGKDAVIQNILNQVSSTMGADTAAQIEDIFLKVGEPKLTFMGSIIGVIILLIGSTGVFVELQKTFNIIWEVSADTKKGILPILRARLFSFGLILVIAFLLLISLVISAALAAMSSWIKADTSGLMMIMFNVVNFVFSFVIISILFALMFKILPDAKIKWKHIWLGSAIAGALFTIGKTALAFFFGTFAPGSVYGAAGSIILILLWVSYSSMITFYGAEFTATHAKMFSGKLPPSKFVKAEITRKAKKKL